MIAEQNTPTIERTAMKQVRRCVRCVMPENYPGISFDHKGVCNFCRYFDNHWGSWMANVEEQQRSEVKLRDIFEAAKRKRRRYDALIGISGGKDSSYCLYLCVKVYGLNVITFTRDGCFLSDEAKARIDKLVTTFNVPHLYYQDPMSAELAGIFMRKTGNFCTACELVNFNADAIIAREFDVPLLILGSSSRTEAPVPKSLNPWDPWYFAKVMRGEGYRERLRCSAYGHNQLLYLGLERTLGRRRIVLLPDYVDWDESKISDLFLREFGFDFGEEHSDCWAHGVAKYLHKKKCGGNHPRVAKYSMLVRSRKMSREEALDKISQDGTDTTVVGLERFLKVIGMTREEFEAASERTPEPYMTNLSRYFNTLRRLVRRQAV